MTAGGTLVAELRLRLARAGAAASPRPQGTVSEVVGLGIGVRGLAAAVGQLVTVHLRAPGRPDRRLQAQVVALHPDGLTAMPLGSTAGVSAGDPVEGSADVLRIPAGPGLLGRVVDALGRPIDGGPMLTQVEAVPLGETSRSQSYGKPSGLCRAATSPPAPSGRP